MEKKKILQLQNIKKNFEYNNTEVKILDDINLDIFEGEIIAILGRSGSGKSTLLRIIADLIKPSSGSILYNGKSIEKTDTKISMIFQNFGLVPWLNVFDNVALGLDKNNLSKEEINDKVTKSINLVGLGGYEEAYPKEMSGGMRQRVGFARALVVNPGILLMDEPFSALDYLTANTLKNDLLELWSDSAISTIKSIIIVTHSIEEAVKLCDKVIVLSSNPAKIVANVKIDLPRPRDETLPKFHKVLDNLFSIMTNSSTTKKKSSDINVHMFPQAVSVITLFHFLLTLKEKSDKDTSIKEISRDLKLTNERLVMLIDSLTLLKFIDINEHNIKLTSDGIKLLTVDEDKQKNIFRNHLLKYVPYIKDIYDLLVKTDVGSISRTDLLLMLEKNFNHDQSVKILDATISWARYADLFSYDTTKEELGIDQHFVLP